MKIENVLNINYNPVAYRKDFLTYYFFRKRKTGIEIIVILSLAVVLFTLISCSVIEDSWTGFMIVLFVLGFLYLVYELYKYLKIRKDINNKSTQLPKNTEKVVFFDNRIEFTFHHQAESVFFGQLKKIKLLNKTLFLIPKEKNEWPLRLNSEEIQNLDLEKTHQMLLNKIKNMG